MIQHVCPADAPDAEKSSSAGLPEQQNVQPLSLAEAILALSHSIDQQNQLLGQIVAQNTDLISILVDESDEDESLVDLSGKPLP